MSRTRTGQDDGAKRQRAELALGSSERDFADFFENASVPLHWVGPDGVVLRVNQAELDLLGYSREEYIGRHISEFHVDPSVIEDILLRLMGGETLKQHPARMRCKDGSVKHVLIHSNGLWDDGNFVHSRCITIDVTARRQVEDALRHSEQKFHLMADAAPALIWIAGPDKLCTWFNRQWLEFTGRALEQELGNGWLDNVHPDDVERCLRVYGTAFDARQPFSLEYRLRRHDGEYRWLLDSGILLPGTGGQFAGYIGSCLDVTERKQAEQALYASEERYRILVESQAEMLCRFRLDGTILFVNGAYARSLGTTPESLMGKNFWSFVPETDRPQVRAMLEGLTPEAPEVSIENRFEAVAGSRWILWTNRALAFDDDGRLTEAQSAGIDITRRKEMEQALQEADRRKDEFLATLAHELRNPLAPIANSLEVLKRAGDNADLLQQARGAIERQMSHLVRLVDDLLDVSRITRDKLELRKAPVELRSLVHDAVESGRPFADEAEQALEVVLPAKPLHLDADPVRLAQILNNLLNNACKYTPRGGRICITAKRLQDDVLISVKDSGIGMPREKLESIFDMFAQVDHAATRSTGGLGIGLTLVKRLVELHGGSIAAMSAGLGQGSEFVVRLPVHAVAPQDQQRNHADIERGSGTRRVLVVDDNRDSADSLALLLQLNGHKTRVVYDGLAAVEEAGRFRPDVVLLDRGLPVLNGIAACRRIREQPWGKKMVIVAVTGWGQEEDRRQSKEAGFDHHVVKPVDYGLLSRLLYASPTAGQPEVL